MQHMSTPFHQSDVSRRGVQVLAVGDRVHETIAELLPSAEQARPHKAQHAVIYKCTRLQTHIFTT